MTKLHACAPSAHVEPTGRACARPTLPTGEIADGGPTGSPALAMTNQGCTSPRSVATSPIRYSCLRSPFSGQIDTRPEESRLTLVAVLRDVRRRRLELVRLTFGTERASQKPLGGRSETKRGSRKALGVISETERGSRKALGVLFATGHSANVSSQSAFSTGRSANVSSQSAF